MFTLLLERVLFWGFRFLFSSDLHSADGPSGMAAGRPRRGAGGPQGAADAPPFPLFASFTSSLTADP